MITFLKRENTSAIRVHFAPGLEGYSKEDLERHAKRNGKLNIGFHYLLHKTGDLEQVMDTDILADYTLNEYKTSIYVLVLADKLTDAQKHKLAHLKVVYALPIVYENCNGHYNS